MNYSSLLNLDKTSHHLINQDELLILKAKEDPRYFDVLYKKYKEKVFNYFLFRVGRNKDTAEELAQETFLKAFKALPNFIIQECTYLTYLLRIAHNLLVNYYRSSKLVLVENVVDVRTTNMDNIGAKLEAEQVWKEMKTGLSVAEQEAMRLKYQRI